MPSLNFLFHLFVKKNKNLLGFVDRVKYDKVAKEGAFHFSLDASGEDLREISKLVSEGKLKTSVRETVLFKAKETPFREEFRLKGMGKRVFVFDR